MAELGPESLLSDSLAGALLHSSGKNRRIGLEVPCVLDPGRLFLISLVATVSPEEPLSKKGQHLAHFSSLQSNSWLFFFFSLTSLRFLLGYLCERKKIFSFIYSFSKNILSACFVPGAVLDTTFITTIGLNFENSRELLAKYSKRKVMFISPSYEVSHVMSSQRYLFEKSNIYIILIANKC